VVFFSFIASRSSCRHDPAGGAADRTYENNLYISQKAEHHVTDFAFAVGPTREEWPTEYMMCIAKIDTALLERFRAFVRIPIEITNMRENLLKIFFRHSEAPHELGPDTLRIVPRVRYDGNEGLCFHLLVKCAFGRTSYVLYIQPYCINVKSGLRSLPL
jgi:hypothetical protein